MSWKQYAPDDPQGLRPFIEDYVDRLIKAGAFGSVNLKGGTAFFVLTDNEEGERIEQQVWDEMIKELKAHIENWSPTE